MASCNKRNELLQMVRRQSFAVRDISLYLDTHPTDTEALSCLQKFSRMLEETREQYTELYGPLRAEDTNSKNCWTWVQTPWPWERQA